MKNKLEFWENVSWIKFIIILILIHFLLLDASLLFAEENSALAEKIKWLNALESSLREQSEKSLTLEKNLQEEQKINVYLFQELKGVNSDVLFSLNKSIIEKRREVENLIKQRSAVVRRISKIIFAKQSANKQALLMQLKSQAARNAEIDKIKNLFLNEKQELESRIFSLEAELFFKKRQLETAISEKADKEAELKSARNVYEKEKSVLQKAMQFQLENCAASQGLVKEKKELEDKLSFVKESYQKQLASLYYYLGLAYTQAKIYPDAINAYTASLEYEPNNFEAHYNLGLLYQYQENNSEKAIYHLRQSLRLDSSGQKRKTIEALMKTLTTKR